VSTESVVQKRRRTQNSDSPEDESEYYTVDREARY